VWFFYQVFHLSPLQLYSSFTVEIRKRLREFEEIRKRLRVFEGIKILRRSCRGDCE